MGGLLTRSCGYHVHLIPACCQLAACSNQSPALTCFNALNVPAALLLPLPLQGGEASGDFQRAKRFKWVPGDVVCFAWLLGQPLHARAVAAQPAGMANANLARFIRCAGS